MVIVRKKDHTNMCLNLNGYRERVVCVSRRNFSRFFFVGLEEERSLQKECRYTDELLAPIFDATARVKKREDRIRRTTRDLPTPVAK